ncbi:MAG: hypothetical protein LC723_03930, partial [Actinobacteria bacterium]|nr:hypothetical protein [Actinomycetota bacterium]
GQLHIFASVSRDPAKFQGTKVGATESVLMFFDGSRWKDIQHDDRQTTTQAQTQDQNGNHPVIDTGARADPIFSVAMEPGGNTGWGVGGTATRLLDEEHHISGTPTGSVYRIDLAGDAQPPFDKADPVTPVPGAFSFAFIADTGCGFGPCSVGVGSGMTADEVLLKARDDINRYAALPSGPKFVVFGGNLRAVGIEEDLASFKGYIRGFHIPVFSAIGQSDLLSVSSGAAGLLPDVSNQNLNNVFDPSSAKGQVVGSNRFYEKVFSDETPPWGTTGSGNSHLCGGDCTTIFKDSGNIGVSPTIGKARTHYAFDFSPAGKPLARFVVLDTSDKQFTKGAALNQNPQGEDQPSWFASIMANALAQSPPLPVIVVSNVPTQNPSLTVKQSRTGMMTDGATLESAAAAASAIFSGSVRTNSVYYVPDAQSPVRVPYFVLGSGGSPIGGNFNPVPTDGHYHAWHLVNVDTSAVNILNPRAAVNVTTVPVIESVALSAPQGLSVPGGNTLAFAAMARGVEGGGPPDHPEQSQRMYLDFPWDDQCSGGDIGPHYGQCVQIGTMTPDYHFISEDERFAVFVKKGPAPGLPLVIDTPQGKRLVKDDQSSLLCTLKYGTVFVRIVSGLHQMRMPVSIGPGTGPCVDYPILKPPPGIIQKLPLIAVPIQAQVQQSALRIPFHPPLLPDPLVVVLPPAPGPIAAPAPPASAAGSRKEEEEAEFEQQGEEETSASFTAIHHRSRYAGSTAPVMLAGFGAVVLGMLSAMVLSQFFRKPSFSPIYARQRSP